MDKGHVSPCLLWVFCYEESNGRKNQLAENKWEYRNVKEEFRTHTYIHDTLFNWIERLNRNKMESKITEKI